jgi:hypothetical protein
MRYGGQPRKSPTPPIYIATRSVNSNGAFARETGLEPEIVYGAPLNIMAMS